MVLLLEQTVIYYWPRAKYEATGALACTCIRRMQRAKHLLIALVVLEAIYTFC